MKKKSSRIISLFLTALVLFSVFTIAPISVSAASKYNATLKASPETVNLNLNTSKTKELRITINGTYPSKTKASWSYDPLVATVNFVKWDSSTIVLNVEGLKVGKTDFKFSIADDSTTAKETVASTVVPIVVTSNQYALKYDANGGTNAPATQYLYYNVDTNISTDIPTRTGYEFMGWAESKTATKATYQAGGIIKLTADKTLYAVWGEKDNIPTCKVSVTNDFATSQKFDMTFTDDKGVKGFYFGLNPLFIINEYFEFPTVEKTSHASATVTSEGTYFIVAEDTAENYSETLAIKLFKTEFETNGGKLDSDSNYTINVNNSKVKLPTPKRNGYSFVGWSKSEDGSSIIKQDTITVTDNGKYYAVWEKGLLIGDVNLDGQISIDDATLTQKFISDSATPSETQLICADVNEDGYVTIDDVTLIQKYVAEMISTF